MRPPIMPSLAELEKAAVHEARRALADKEECTCKVCRKVEAALPERSV